MEMCGILHFRMSKFSG